ncbi:MATE family efflux transporter [Blastochloris sulfoviridis]|uniref:MATE family efflux transporter n=1 Tax=Blastochloris sulfoviridis TaxID=50712 RepID=A0A5M6I466_9HYPH|nr:MATE family efflux transporter [Blastochloris sulfoviridis]KAA5602647.1 MATE family efflux transporter [Blastochloris sulfoviridis]
MTEGSVSRAGPASRSRLLPTLLVLSGPIIVSQFAQMANGVVDVVMAGNLGVLTLGAIAVGAAVWTPMMIFLLGLLYGMTPAIGARLGEGDPAGVAGIVLRGVVVGVLGGALLGLALSAGCGPLFRAVGVAPELIPEATAYLQWVALALPGMGLFLAVRFTLEAHRAPAMVTVVIVVGVLAKIWLNDAFVHGHAGLPALGSAGFGAATAAVSWGMALALMGVTRTHGAVRYLWQRPPRIAELSLARIVRFCLFGLPIALNFLSDYLVMGVVSVFIATIGAVAIGAHQIAFNILMVMLMIPTGLSMAATILISRSAGGSDRASLRPLMAWTMGLAVVSSLAMAAGLAAFDAEVAGLYTQDPAVTALALDLLWVVALILTVDVVAIALGFFLRGLGDPGSPFLIQLGVHWLFSLPLGYALCFTDWIVAPLGPIGWWYGLSAGLIFTGLLMALRLRLRMAGSPVPAGAAHGAAE